MVFLEAFQVFHRRYSGLYDGSALFVFRHGDSHVWGVVHCTGFYCYPCAALWGSGGWVAFAGLHYYAAGRFDPAGSGDYGALYS